MGRRARVVEESLCILSLVHSIADCSIGYVRPDPISNMHVALWVTPKALGGVASHRISVRSSSASGGTLVFWGHDVQTDSAELGKSAISCEKQ